MSSNLGSKPDRTLLFAILERALLDAFGKTGVHYRKTEKRTIEDARSFIMDDDLDVYNHPPFSFGWICEHLELDPLKVRRIIAQKIDLNGQRREIPFYQDALEMISSVTQRDFF